MEIKKVSVSQLKLAPFFYLFTKGHVYKPSKIKEDYSAS
mgnify:CR=1 FL=1